MIRRLLFSLLGLALFAWPANATWSIVIVNRATGEVAIGSATCIPQTDLTRGLPTIVVGRGVGVIQAFSGGEAGLVIIAQGFKDGLDPQAILDLVEAAETDFQGRQIGIVGLVGSPVTFTGTKAQGGKGGVVGEVGDLAYAIQGNVLTGIEVVLAAEQALLTTPGDTGQKLLAAMVAARNLGGDGRCSCSISIPTSCGVPPDSFTKSAHVGFVIVARKGDVDSPCVTGFDCAMSRSYLRLNIRGLDATPNDPDPVDQLVGRYAVWRTGRVGRPDGLLSLVSELAPLPADGVTRRTVTVRLVDIEGDPLTSGGADVQVRPREGTTPSAGVGSVTDHGDGTYSFVVTAGTEVGTDAFVITATDDFLTATLYPCLEVQSVQAGPLRTDVTELSAALGGTVAFELDDLGPFLHIPLNPDRLTIRTLVLAGRPDVLPGTFGFLDDAGHAQAAFIAQPRMLLDLVGLRMDWSALVVGFGGPPVATNAVGFDIVP